MDSSYDYYMHMREADPYEEPRGYAWRATNSSKIHYGATYCGVHACWTMLQQYNCSCAELVVVSQEANPFAAPCSLVIAGDACKGTLFDQCPDACYTFWVTWWGQDPQ